LLIRQWSAAHAQPGDSEVVQWPAPNSEIASIHAVLLGFSADKLRFRSMITSDCDCANRRFTRMNPACFARRAPVLSGVLTSYNRFLYNSTMNRMGGWRPFL